MQPLLTLENVNLQFPLVEKILLRDISYQIYPGDFVIVLGSNGSGKSSLLKLIDKTYHPTVGKITFRGRDIKNVSNRDYFLSVKTLTQSTLDSLFPSLTILENYHLFNQANSSQALTHNFKDYLQDFNEKLIFKLNQPVNHLSGGEKQALALALIMLHPPDLLLLDEHTSALDPKSSDNIMEVTNKIVKKYGVTCLLTTHNLETAVQYGNRLLSLKEGNIYHTIENKNSVILKTTDLIKLCY